MSFDSSVAERLQDFRPDGAMVTVVFGDDGGVVFQIERETVPAKHLIPPN